MLPLVYHPNQPEKKSKWCNQFFSVKCQSVFPSCTIIAMLLQMRPLISVCSMSLIQAMFMQFFLINLIKTLSYNLRQQLTRLFLTYVPVAHRSIYLVTVFRKRHSSHNVVSSTPHLSRIQTHNISGVISYKKISKNYSV